MSLRWCVLIPARNEAAAIGGVVKPLVQAGIEVLVMDDGSSDQTVQTAQAAGAMVVCRQAHHGKGAALREGFAWAIARGYDAVVTMDADGQHATDDVPRLATAAQSTPAELIVGNRMEHPKRMPIVRRLTNRFMSAVLSGLTRQRIPDSQCGLRLIRCDLLRRCHLRSDHFEIESELLLEAARLGARIESIPIQSIYCAERSQISPFIDTARFLRLLWHHRRRA